MRTLLFYILCLFSLLALCTTGIVPDGYQSVARATVDDSIRVALLKNEPSVTVSGDGLIATDSNGMPVMLESPVVIKSERNSVSVQKKLYPYITIAAASELQINGKMYRGRIEIRPQEKGLLVINQLPLEEYLVGLINAEISSSWPIEAVKSQAVIARTYALNRKDARKTALYHLESTVLDQVYAGSGLEDSRAMRAVSETAGQVLTYAGSIIQAFYHSNCGGKTEAAENVWGAKLPYMTGVDCQYCLSNPSTQWEAKLPLQEIEEKVRTSGIKIGTLTDIRTGERNSRGRLTAIQLISSRNPSSVTGDQFRKIVGYGVIKSTNFMVKISGGTAYFSGSGNGHGVGLCQWGAKQRSLDGFSYQEILSYYYPGTELKTVSEMQQR